MPRLELSLLGGFVARLDEGPSIEFPRRKAQALLAYLALSNGSATRRDSLAALLWGDYSDDRARHSLRQVVATLRRALAGAGGVLVETAEGVAIRGEACHVDVERFERLVKAGTEESLSEAVRLYRGDLLAGVTVGEAPYEEWLLSERERLREMVVESLARLVSLYAERGALEAGIQAALRLLALDPTIEAAHRALMRLYVREGRRTAALRQYQACLDVLRRELGAAPEAATRELYRELVTAPPSPLPRGEPSEPSPSPLPVALPALAGLDDLAPLVGRERELSALRDLAAWPMRGRGAAAVVLGEAGLGKSRLLAAVVREAAEAGARVVHARAWETEKVLPLAPWVAALRDAGLVADAAPRLDARSRGELSRVFPELSDAPVPAPSSDVLRLFDALARLVAFGAAPGRPLLLALDDLHWADELSLRFLGFLVRRITELPAFLLVAARSEELADAPLLNACLREIAGCPRTAAISLQALTREDTLALVRSVCRAGPDRQAARFAEAVWKATAGHPFMAVETARSFDREGSVPRNETIGVPGRVRDLVASNLARVGPRARELAAVAAVIGREVEFGVLADAAGLTTEEAARRVEALVERRVLRASGDGFVFGHDWTQSVVYQAVLPGHRKLLHERAARALEAHGRHATPLALGHHWFMSERWGAAFAHLADAGRMAAARFAYRDAASCFERAVDAFDRGGRPSDRQIDAVDVLFELRQAMVTSGDLARIDGCLRRAESLASASRDGHRLAWTRAFRGHLATVSGRPAEAIALLEPGRRGKRSAGDGMLSAARALYLGQAYYMTGRYREAEAILRPITRLREATVTRAQLPLAVAVGPIATTFLALTLVETGELCEAAGLGQGVIESCEAVDNPWGAWHGHLAAGAAAARQGDFETAVTILRRGVEMCRQRDLPFGLGWLTPALGYALVLAGRLAEARDVRAATAQLDTSPLGALFAGELALREGDLGEAGRLAGAGMALADRRQESGLHAWLAHLVVRVALQREAPPFATARRVLDAALCQARQSGMRPLAAQLGDSLAELCRRCGERPA